MSLGYMQKIRMIIQEALPGTVFVIKDFEAVADPSTIRQSVKRLTESQELLRIFPGFFQKPAYNSRGELEPVDTELFAKAAARHFGWKIAPSGQYALYRLGLTPYMPEKTTFICSGQYRTYNLRGRVLDFKHRDLSYFEGRSDKTLLVLQGLKALGRAQADAGVISILAAALSPQEKQDLWEQTERSYDWLDQVIRQIVNYK